LKPSVFLAIPVNRPIDPLVVESYFVGGSPLIARIFMESSPSKRIDDKRNACVEAFLETDLTHLLFWDSDTIASLAALDRLLKTDKPVIGGVVYRKGGEFAPVFGDYDPAQRLFRVPTPFQYNEIRKVDICGTGFILIKREVFEKLERPWFQCYEKGNAWEDIYFCLKCKEAGIPVYVDTGLHCGHIADNFIVTNETYEMHTLWRLVKRIRDRGDLPRFQKVIERELRMPAPELNLEGVPEHSVRFTSQLFGGYQVPPLLREAYLQYIKDVSSPVWAISWELAVYLDKLIQELRPNRILDLGSGFSSLVFRRYEQAETTSVDIDPLWLEKTRLFLEDHQLSTANMHLMQDFKFEGDYDLILLDAGLAQKDRGPLFEKCKQHCSGIIVLDDMHMPDYRAAAHHFFKNDLIIDLKLDTIDSYQRYAWMIVPKK